MPGHFQRAARKTGGNAAGQHHFDADVMVYQFAAQPAGRQILKNLGEIPFESGQAPACGVGQLWQADTTTVMVRKGLFRAGSLVNFARKFFR